MDPTTGLAMPNGQVQAQAAMIGYIDDFRLMMYVTLAMIPLLALLALLKVPGRSEVPTGAPAPAIAVAIAATGRRRPSGRAT